MIVFQRYFQFTWILSAILFCLSCSPIAKISNPKPELQYAGDESRISAEVFEKLGHQVRSFTEGNPSEWHKAQFQTLWVKSLSGQKPNFFERTSQHFPRYMVAELFLISPQYLKLSPFSNVLRCYRLNIDIFYVNLLQINLIDLTKLL